MKGAGRTAVRILSWITAALIVSACLVVPASAAGGMTEYTNYIESVTVGGGKLKINLRLTKNYVSEHAGEQIHILAEPAYEDRYLPEYSIATASVSEKLELRADYSEKLRGYKFAAVHIDGDVCEPVTGFRYIENIGDTARTKTAFPKYASVKGVSFCGASDALGMSLEPSHTVIDIDLCDIMLGKRADGAIENICGGFSYYYDGAAVAELDTKVERFSRAGTCVYFRILLSDKMIGASLGFLYAASHPSETAEYYSPDMNDVECCRYLEAFFEFLAERYSFGGEHGFAASYIIGTDVNSNRRGSYYGPARIVEYTENYAALLRLAYNTVCSVYKNSRVYVPIGGNFNAKTTDLGFVGDDSLDYSAKAFLEELDSKISGEGDFLWNIAADGSPSDGRTDLREDSNALFSADTQFITMRNIEVLESFISGEEFLCRGQHRRIIVDRFSISSRNESSGELLQAAVYAYACCRAAGSGYIEALIYSDYSENGQGSGILDADGRPKEIFDTIKYIDSDEKYRIADTVPAYLGTQNWDELGADSGAPAGKYGISVSEAVALSEVSRKLYALPLFDFSQGNKQGFEAGAGMNYSSLEYDAGEDSPVLRAVSRELSPGGYAELCAYGLNKNISTAKYISFRLKADSAELSGVRIMIRLYGSTSGGKTVVCECENRLRCSVWNDVCFDISGLSAQCGKLGRVEILLGADGETGDFTAELSAASATLYSGTSGNAYTVLIWAALVLFVLAIAVAICRNVYISRRRVKGRQMKFDI